MIQIIGVTLALSAIFILAVTSCSILWELRQVRREMRLARDCARLEAELRPRHSHAIESGPLEGDAEGEKRKRRGRRIGGLRHDGCKWVHD